MQTTKCLLVYVLLVSSFFSYSQSEEDYMALLTPVDLKEKANAVVRYHKKVVEVNAYNRMKVTTTRIVTIFNKYGDNQVNAFQGYDKNRIIKKMEAKVYDENGKEIKKIKKNDFVDESAVGGGTLYSDNRVKYLNYTPVNYPYTVEFLSVVEYKTTAFIPQWRPIDDFYLAVQYSEFQLVNNSDVKVRYKSENFEGYNIEALGEFHYVAKNIPGIKYESYSPSILGITPVFKTALTKFDMEGVEGINNNWKDFGKWMYDKLLTGTDDLPESAINDVKALTKDVEDKMEKARLVYKYMQDKTRYISVQVGIGGWKPMLANHVDKLGYADCKGLTNYTKALLEVVNVPSFYTVVYGSKQIKNMDKEFSVTEGNHVILCVPDGAENVFLECTSQTVPFGFTAGFTDDRDVLLVTPEGGEIVHTKIYTPEESMQHTEANVILDDTGSFDAAVSIKTTGYQYNLHEDVQNKSPRDQKLWYKNYWDNINNLNVKALKLNDDKSEVVFTERFELEASNYASKSGKRLVFQPNMFNRTTKLPTRYNERSLDFKIDRGYKDVDEYIIQLPEGMIVEAMSEGASITNKFGTYEYKLEQINANELKYSRTYIMNKGYYSNSDYDAFRDFKKSVVKHDKAKIVLIKN